MDKFTSKFITRIKKICVISQYAKATDFPDCLALLFSIAECCQSIQ